MLSPNDVHQLVGLLTMILHPKDVEIELGSMILDIVAQEKRDVDITVLCKAADDRVSAFKGIEVKDHTRPLDVAQVEQLLLKLIDMPSLTEKAIVSASGYTDPAIKKAQYYNVNLYRLDDWEPSSKGFDYIRPATKFDFAEHTFEWLSPPKIIFNPGQTKSDVVQRIFDSNPKLYSLQTGVQSEVPDLETFRQSLLQKCLHLFSQNSSNRTFKADQTEDIMEEIDLNPVFSVQTSGEFIVLEKALIGGTIVCREGIIAPTFKILVKQGETTPEIGCAVGELSNGNLIGVTFENRARRLSIINIPIDDRLLKKIYRKKLQ